MASDRRPRRSDADVPRFRSGAVARMLAMPVRTLQVWERRYAVCAPHLTASGQRLYTAADVERLAAIKRLTDLGHAIGSLAVLDMRALQAIAATHASTLSAAAGVRRAAERPAERAHRSPPPAAERRWSDAALADFAGLSSTVACECPKHVAELLIQLTHFEAYSAQCEQRSPADARLHGRLRRVTAQARASFELALEYVARHEGLTLPG